LHKPKNLTLYNTQLTYCICQFLDKEPPLVDMVFRLLLRMWPMGNSPKEVLFISEIEELLNVVDELHFKRVRVPIFKRVGACFKSQHFQVAERALYLWSNDHIVSLVADSADTILPIIYGVLFFNAYHHWNRSIRSLSLGSLQLFQEIDGPLYNRIARQYKEEQDKLNPKPAPPPQGKTPDRTPFFANKTISPPDGKPQEGPPIRRKSLLPVDPSTLAALTVHKSLEDIVTSGDDYDDNDSNSDNSDSDPDRYEGDDMDDEPNNADNADHNTDTGSPGAGNNNSKVGSGSLLRHKIRSS